jgi:SagB-type dehydrogenase family enzyme
MRTSLLQQPLTLPGPVLDGTGSLERALAARRSVRRFARRPLSLAEVGQLAWAAGGRTGDEGRRTAPSAGGTHPIEVLVVAGAVEGLPPGVWHYRPAGHALVPLAEGDLRAPLAAAALDQEWVRLAPAVLVLDALPERTTARYGKRGRQYVLMEAGHMAQNVLLQATALGLGGVVVGAFDHARVRSLLGLRADEEPLALLPVGRPRARAGGVR